VGVASRRGCKAVTTFNYNRPLYFRFCHAHVKRRRAAAAPGFMHAASSRPTDYQGGSVSLVSLLIMASTSSSAVHFDSIDDTVADIKAGKFVIVLDDENRENEGDLIISAQSITSKQMAWFIKHTRCVVLCFRSSPSLLKYSLYLTSGIIAASSAYHCIHRSLNNSRFQ
jgi:hypothetical protein